ncbi:alpha/beta hydrolase [Patulibacter defluvii]|uniref:alpha/beta hydrolase n=1 Tax=Patulibacter defluvii TaxID=3095358 RepID=UPI002A74CEF3|nr:phospholipase [Patulibacter sp. DM4]
MSGEIVPLVHRERPADGEPEGLLVLHHGRGADEHDLLGLADVLDRERRLHVVTPGGPLRLPGWPGRHWYAVPRVGFPDPETFATAWRSLAAFHDELWERTGIAPERTVLGGFSMGAVMSYALGLGRLEGEPRRPAVAGVLALSGFVPTVDGFALDAAGRPTRALVAHGQRDGVIGHPFAVAAREQLTAAGIDLTALDGPGDHQIDPTHVLPIADWLGATLASAGPDRIGR